MCSQSQWSLLRLLQISGRAIKSDMSRSDPTRPSSSFTPLQSPALIFSGRHKQNWELRGDVWTSVHHRQKQRGVFLWTVTLCFSEKNKRKTYLLSPAVMVLLFMRAAVYSLTHFCPGGYIQRLLEKCERPWIGSSPFRFCLYLKTTCRVFQEFSCKP